MADTTYRVVTELSTTGGLTSQLSAALAAASALDAKLSSIRKGVGGGSLFGAGARPQLDAGDRAARQQETSAARFLKAEAAKNAKAERENERYAAWWAKSLDKQEKDAARTANTKARETEKGLRMERAAHEDFSTRIGGITSGLASGFTGAIEKAGALALTVAKIGLAGAAAGAAFGLHMSLELEKTQISLASIFGAQGLTRNMDEGMGLAGDMMKKIRKDAADLPGTTEDLVRFFRLGATPGLQAGMNVKDLEALSAKAMAAAASNGMDMHTGAREFSMLLQGRAGAHNVLGLMLPGTPLSGAAAQKFNKSSPEERVKFLTAEFDKFGPSIKTFGTSFDAMWSGAVDNAKLFLGNLSGPVFNKLKQVLSEANSWWDQNKTTALGFADDLGQWFGFAFDRGKQLIKDWWPAIKTFAMHAFDELKNIWAQIEPIVARVGEGIKSALNDPKTIARIEELLKLYGMVKVGGVALSAGQTAAGAIGSGVSLWQKASTIGQGVSAASDASKAAASTAELVTGMSGFSKALTYATPALIAIGALFAGGALYNLLFNKDKDVYKLDQNKDYEGGTAYNSFAAGKGIYTKNNARPKLGPTEIDYEPSNRKDFEGSLPVANVRPLLESLDERVAKKVKGGGGTNIQKVEIVVTSNQDPNRIAREVKDILAFNLRAPRASSYARNNSATR